MLQINRNKLINNKYHSSHFWLLIITSTKSTHIKNHSILQYSHRNTPTKESKGSKNKIHTTHVYIVLLCTLLHRYICCWFVLCMLPLGFIPSTALLASLARSKLPSSPPPPPFSPSLVVSLFAFFAAVLTKIPTTILP